MSSGNILKVAFCACLLSGGLYGQEGDAAFARRPIYGARFELFEARTFSTGTADSATAKPLAEYHYTASSGASKMWLTPTFEYLLSRHLSIGTEFRLRRLKYSFVTEMLSGRKDPNASSDDRNTTTITETTRFRYWEFPAIVRYYGLLSRGWLSKPYLAGGVTYRRLQGIRTGTEYAYADATTDYNEVAATPKRRSQLGVFAGIGMRVVDNGSGITVTPEVRYTKWQGVVFSGPAYHTSRGQLEAGVGFTF
jgi:hypothetical protein